ncbi:MAG: (5-formylfuran-3-yl)methyl phosphate synthase [Promethearchaeati archaeon SRVP18_Atabeyarchaeia-1]
MKLLVSPRDEGEALEAVAGGADIIDVKNPVEGSLGANFPWIIRRIREVVPAEIEVSAAVGDVPDLPGTVSLAALGVATLGANYIKVGLSGPRSIDGATYLMSCVVHAVRDLDPRVKVVAAAYADWTRAGTVNPAHVPEIAKRSGSRVAMVDTKIKDGKRLFDFLSHRDLDLFIKRSHDLGLLAALAGSLQKEDLPLLAKLNADIVGVRTAVCERLDRINGRITRVKVRELVNVIRESSPDHALRTEPAKKGL